MKKIAVIIISVIFIPFIITSFFYEYKLQHIQSGFNSNKDETVVRVLTKNNTVEKINLEDYLVGVVSGEVPVSFEKEAIKAQAVAARTYALKQIENHKNYEYDVKDDTSSQVYQTDEELRNKWGNNYDEYVKKIKECVNETEGEYVSYNNEVIYAFFFSTSNGKTEDNKNVFGKDLPYLKVVDSSFDESETKNFTTVKIVSLDDFYKHLNLEKSDELNITDIVRTESGRISSIMVNGKAFTGRDFQKRLSLRSNDFTIQKNNENITITTKGFGHGVGMSQYGANALAKRHKTYDEILKYYYQGTNLQKL